MPTHGQVVDYSLQRRALLRAVYAGRVDAYEVCDASAYLKSAARFHGEATDLSCPVCRRDNLTLVRYIYGDELKASAGQARSVAELDMLAVTLSEFQVYVVEVCRGCGWNHLIEQYSLGRATVSGQSVVSGQDVVAGRAGAGSGGGGGRIGAGSVLVAAGAVTGRDRAAQRRGAVE